MKITAGLMAMMSAVSVLMIKIMIIKIIVIMIRTEDGDRFNDDG